MDQKCNLMEASQNGRSIVDVAHMEALSATIFLMHVHEVKILYNYVYSIGGIST